MKSHISSDLANGNAALAAEAKSASATAAPKNSEFIAVTPPPTVGSKRTPVILGAVALVAILAAGWAAYHEVEAIQARSHARERAQLASASETVRSAEPPGEFTNQDPQRQPAAVSLPRSEAELASLDAVSGVDPAVAGAPEKPPAAWQKKPNPGSVSTPNREPIRPAAQAHPAPVAEMFMPGSSAAAEPTLFATEAIEASPVVELERARSAVRGEPPPNSAQLFSRRSAANARFVDGPASGTGETSPSTKAGSFALEPAVKADDTAAERTMRAGSALRPEVLGETIDRVPTDRPTNLIDSQASFGDVTSSATFSAAPAAKFASPGIESTNQPTLVPVAATVVRAHWLPQTDSADVSLTLPDNAYMAIGATWPDEAAASSDTAGLPARPGGRASDTPSPQTERATINVAGRNNAGPTETVAALPADQETAQASGQDPSIAAVLPSTSILAVSRTGALQPANFESRAVVSPPGSVDVARLSSPSAPTGAEALMLARGEAHLQSGDFAAARVFFERAGRNHLAALGLAKTYDPLYFAESGIVGARGDRKLALKWYREATEGALHEAAERLRKLEAALE